MSSKRVLLPEIAERLARRPLRGNSRKCGPDLQPILSHFKRKNRREGFDWCAAFVYHCCVRAGFPIPVRQPEPVRWSFAAVPAWLQWAKLAENRFYYSVRHPSFRPRRGDLIVFDNLLGRGPQDHIGVVLSAGGQLYLTAEGNVNNQSGVFERYRRRNVRGFIRIPNNYSYVPVTD